MQKRLLTFAAALTLLAVGATATGAQVVVDHGYYPGGGMVVIRGPVYAVDCYRWKLVRTPKGRQWRKVNLCHARVRFTPTYPIWHPNLTAYY